MAEIQGTLSDFQVETSDEQIFSPGVETEIIAVLEPDPVAAFQALPKFSVPKKSLVIDIETTGNNPWDARLITIGYLDPSPEDVQPVVIFENTEEQTVRNFLQVFEEGGYTEIIGYNVDFDYRWIFVICQRYRIQAPVFMAAKLYDMMFVEKTGQPGFVSTTNKNAKLDTVAESLIGLGQLEESKKIAELFEKGEFQKIIDHVANDVVLTYAIWVLDQFVRGKIQLAFPAPGQQTISFKQESPARVVGNIPEEDKEQRSCPVCKFLQPVPKGPAKVKCAIEVCPGLL